MVDLMDALRKSTAGQKEMLMPIAGKKPEGDRGEETGDEIAEEVGLIHRPT